MEKEEIIKCHPSLCYTCEHARKPAADENRDKGYVGCSIPARNTRLQSNDDEMYFNFISGAKELATGWVDLRSRIFGNKSGVTSNCQLLTLEVTKCSEYQHLK